MEKPRYSGIDGLAEFPPLRIPAKYIEQMGGEWRMCGTGPEDTSIFALNPGEKVCGGALLPEGWDFADERDAETTPYACCTNKWNEAMWKRVEARREGQLWLPGFNEDPLSEYFGEMDCVGEGHHSLCPGEVFECELTLTPEEVERLIPKAPDGLVDGGGDE